MIVFVNHGREVEGQLGAVIHEECDAAHARFGQIIAEAGQAVEFARFNILRAGACVQLTQRVQVRDRVPLGSAAGP